MIHNLSSYGDRCIDGLPIAVIDFETTGIDARHCCPVEMSIVHMNLGSGNPEVVYEQRFNPGEKIPLEASLVHHIYDEDVQDLLGFADHIDEIQELLQGRVISAYNLPYDYKILSRYSDHHKDFFGICGLNLSRYLDPYARGKSRHSLGNTCSRHGITLSSAHSAAADSFAAAQLLDIQYELLLKGDIYPGTMKEFWEWHVSVGRSNEESYKKYLEESGRYETKYITDRWYPWLNWSD